MDDKISSVAERDIEPGEILEYTIRGRRMRACTIQGIKAGQRLFWYSSLRYFSSLRNRGFGRGK